MTGAARRGGVVVLDEATVVRLDARALGRLAEGVLARLDLAGAALGVRLVDDGTMRRLNAAHLGRDRTTNVLSFPVEEAPGGHGRRELGDVVLAPATIRRRAAKSGRDEERDVRHLLVHGVLHLLGYDHVGSAAERERMRAREAEVLAALARAGLGVRLFGARR